MRHALQQGAYPADVVPDPEVLFSTAQEEAPDAVLVDYTSLNQAETAEVLQQCRQHQLPVLALIPRDALSSYDVTQHGDDFLLLPCDPQEVTTRVRQLLWHLQGAAGQKVLQFDDLRIDLERYEVSLRGRPVLLSYKEYQLLALLASNPGRVYTREALLSRIWGYDYLGGSRTVDVHVRRLRSKLGEGQDPYVQTIWNVGYRFRAAPRGATPP